MRHILTFCKCQVLLHSPYFLRWVQSEEAEHCTKCLIGKECLICRIVKTVKDMRKASGVVFRPAVFVALVRCEYLKRFNYWYVVLSAHVILYLMF